MNEVTVGNFRCFNEQQTVRLAPLTLLVGENSTGKTSFLALIRALWDIAFREQLPDFKEPPYDLGSFDEIAHHRGGRGGRAVTFEAGFSHRAPAQRPGRSKTRRVTNGYHFEFRRDGPGVLPAIRRITAGAASAECRVDANGVVSVAVKIADRGWKIRLERSLTRLGVGWDTPQRDLPPLGYLIRLFLREVQTEPERLERFPGTTSPPGEEDLDAIKRFPSPVWRRSARPFAGAPVRSRPRRTYDPSQALPDPEGEHIPMLLAAMARRGSNSWETLKAALEDFGQDAGLFDEVGIKVLGGKAGGPFQVRVRKLGKRSKGPQRNLIDVGYGVNQVLPVATELLRPKGPRLFLLQQPEVHLHPSAQAALGSLFASVASKRRKQLIVETHSDHLIDRIRMDVRDGKTRLQAEHVSILYFERRNLAVEIHSLGWDANGNLVGRPGPIPDGYREFFRTERRRSLGL